MSTQPHDPGGRFVRNPDPRGKRINIRLTAAEYADIADQAEAGAVSLSEYCRRRVLGRRVLSRADQVMIRELRRIAGLQKHLFSATETGKAHADDTAEILHLIKDAIRALGAR